MSETRIQVPTEFNAATPGQLVSFLIEAIQAGELIPAEFAPFVQKYLPLDFQQAARFRPATVPQILSSPRGPGLISGAMNATPESATPSRRQDEFDRRTPGVIREDHVRGENAPQSVDEALDRGFGIARSKMPNAYRGPLDKEEPSLPPQANWWDT